MIGEKIPGDIIKTPCEPYSYSVPNSDEIITLDFTCKFVSEGAKVEAPVDTEAIMGE